MTGSKSKASEGASQSVTRSVSSSSSLSTEVSSDGGYTSGFEEEFGLNPDSDSDGQSGGFELDERGKEIASIGEPAICCRHPPIQINEHAILLCVFFLFNPACLSLA